jgi:hypothetical protein
VGSKECSTRKADDLTATCLLELLKYLIKFTLKHCTLSRDSAVGIATGYGLDD